LSATFLALAEQIAKLPEETRKALTAILGGREQ
jgi:hypothetical protein